MYESGRSLTEKKRWTKTGVVKVTSMVRPRFVPGGLVLRVG